MSMLSAGAAAVGLAVIGAAASVLASVSGSLTLSEAVWLTVDCLAAGALAELASKETHLS
jgi:hypothetical protein